MLAVVASAGCGITGVDDNPLDDNSGLTYGDSPTPMPALEAVPYDALGSKGRLVFERISETGSPSGCR